jgi:5'-nucleotidase
MLRRRISGLLIIGMVLTGLATTAAQARPPSGPDRPPPGTVAVQLLSFTDFLGALEPVQYNGEEVGGAAFLAGLVRELSQEDRNTLVAYSGDTVGGSPLLSALFHDEPTVELMNLLGVDVAGVGNHEFDEGTAELHRMVEGGCHPTDGCFGDDGFPGADYPLLAANVVDKQTGQPILPPYVVKRVQGMPIGFIGLTLEDTPSVVLPSAIEDVRFLDESDTVARYTAELQAQGVESIVVLIHQGGAVSTSDPNECADPQGPVFEEIEQSPAAVDAWVAGHTLSTFVCEVDGDPVTMAGDKGKFVTELDLVIDRRSKDVVDWRATNHLTTHDVAPDPDAQALVDEYKALVGDTLERVVGTVGGPASVEPDNSGETAMGNLVADSQAAAVAGATVAFMNPGGVVSGLDSGDVTVAEVFESLPYGNHLVAMDLTGEQILRLLDQQWCDQDFPRILQVSAALEYSWRQGDSVACHDRVIDSSVQLAGQPLNAAESYRIVTNNFLASGGDGFSVFTEGRGAVAAALATDALADYLPDDAVTAVPELDRVDVVG